MRYLTGAFGVIAACGFVIYSAVTTFHVAHDMTTEFKELAGWAASGIVLWECLGLLYVRQCWANGSKLLAVAGLALVIAAGVYTVRLDLRFQVAGQSDLTETRRNSAQKLDGVKAELTKARADRDILRKLRRPTDAQADALVRIEQRIDVLESKWDTTTVVSTPMPEAGWASRMLRGGDEAWWTDALMVFGLMFWPLARMVALPVAIVSMQSARKPVQAVDAPSGMQVAPPTPKPALPRPVPQEAHPEEPVTQDPIQDPQVTKEAAVFTPRFRIEAPKPVLVTPEWTQAIIKARTNAERLEAVDVITQRWLDSGTTAIARGSFTPLPDLYDDYCRFCEVYKVAPVNDSHLGRSLGRLKISRKKTAKCVHYGLKIKKVRQTAVA